MRAGSAERTMQPCHVTQKLTTKLREKLYTKRQLYRATNGWTLSYSPIRYFTFTSHCTEYVCDYNIFINIFYFPMEYIMSVLSYV